MFVRLTWAEMMTAYHIASQRRIVALKKGFKPRFGAPDKEGSEEIDIWATRGEMAVAKCLNLYWSGSSGEVGAVDVGGIVEVRTITRERNSLIIHKEDRDWAPYILVDASQYPDFRLAGWVFGWEGKQEEYWRDPTRNNRHAYFVGQEHLKHMNDIFPVIDGLREGLRLGSQAA